MLHLAEFTGHKTRRTKTKIRENVKTKLNNDMSVRLMKVQKLQERPRRARHAWDCLSGRASSAAASSSSDWAEKVSLGAKPGNAESLDSIVPPLSKRLLPVLMRCILSATQP